MELIPDPWAPDGGLSRSTDLAPTGTDPAPATLEAARIARTDPDDTLALAERSCVAQGLAEPAAVRFAVDLAPGDFRDARLGQMWGLLQGLVASGSGPTDLLSIIAAVERRTAEREGLPAGKRGPAWPTGAGIRELAMTVTDKSIAEHAAIVRDHSVRRQIIAECQALLHQAHTDPDSTKLASAGVARFTAVRDRTADARPADDVTLLDLLRMPVAYRWVIEGLLEQGDRMMLTGEEGGGKSYLIRQILLMAAAGLHPFTGAAIDPIDVMAVDVENSPAQWQRKTARLAAECERWGQRNPAPHVQVHCVPSLDLTSDRGLGWVHRLLDDHDPKVLAIGPIYRLSRAGVDKEENAMVLLRALETIRERGVALLIEAHAGHGKDKAGRREMRPRGASAQMGWPEFGLGLVADRKDPALFHLERWRGDRDERAWPETIRRYRAGAAPQQWPWVVHRQTTVIGQTGLEVEV